ncbi:pilus assembly FimT family protein [Psychromonas ossibalaenae]|uniref:pilus assembly FimT family protein n=1 Tax=Psychromonas ossibalaenae TaxID=444922 RepID=UPI00036456FF|nr:GspH/FimT family pseudopilin [Psychromonas ossibalaenae]
MYPVKGFTLLELIIVLIISMLLITIGIPGFQTLIQNNRLTSVAGTIQHHLLFARNQSFNLITDVTVCPLDDNTNKCTNNWISGIDVFTDTGDKYTKDGNDILLKTGEPFNAGDQLVFPRKNVTYSPDGQITGSSENFRYCTGEQRIGVHVAYSGRAKVIDGSEFTDCN